VKERVPFTIIPNRIKPLGINLTKDLQNIHCENYKTLLKDVKEDRTKLEDVPYSWLF
jgi:hypothetical protein